MLSANGRPLRILAAVYHCYVDQSSGAAISLKQFMEAFSRRGCEIRVLTGPQLDYERTQSTMEQLDRLGISSSIYHASHSDAKFSLRMFRLNGVTCGIWEPEGPDVDLTHSSGAAWLSSYRDLLDSWNPDVLVTYGGQWFVKAMIKMAKDRNIRTVFYLCNYAYSDASHFMDVDRVITQSRFHQRWFDQHLGVASSPVYPYLSEDQYRCPDMSVERFVTIVNPQPAKGVYPFCRIVDVLQRARPDIRFLAVEGRGSSDWIRRSGIRLPAANLFSFPIANDPRDYLRRTKVMLMPSVWQESFGRVAAEAMVNGIPVIGSTRGSLPEVIGNAEMLIDLPAWLQPESRSLPSRAEVQRWCDKIVRLWDDTAYYERQAQIARQRTKRWRSEMMVDRFLSLISE